MNTKAPVLQTVEGPMIPIGTSGLTIGRDSANQLHIEDPDVSSWHCRIERSGEDFILINNDGNNPTLVNGGQIVRITLQHGDLIQVGKHRMRYLTKEESSEV